MTTESSRNIQAQIAEVEQRIERLPALAEKHATKLKWGVGIAACFILAPVVWTGIVGLTGALVFGAIAYGSAMAAPVLAKRLSHMKYEALKVADNKHLEALQAEKVRHLSSVKAAAASSPVETLWLGWKDNEKVLKNRRDALVSLDGKTRTFGEKMEGFRKKFGENVPEVAKYADRHQRMAEVVEMRRRKLAQLTQAHADKKDIIERAEGLWELALASMEFDEASGTTVEEKFYANLREQTAFDSIESTWNKAGAEFDQMMSEELVEFRPSKTLGFNPSEAIDVKTLSVRDKV
jgi:hypothetical protein